ncbi:MAG: hypothetical protein H6649_12920 [Caldilineae bacterium]|nr:hypothetical protein [Anaerolineae bacterium]MCB9154938.1 hypothetical protein [Caldilineae bacterium]
MDQIDGLFSRMDDWQHLPKYQLERRADLFFSLYLAEAIEVKVGFPINPQIVPEFPVKKCFVKPGDTSSQSINIDYLAVSQSGDVAILVELKTDEKSRNLAQDEALFAAHKVGLPTLVSGIVDIFKSSSCDKRKYFYLLEYLENLGLVRLPSDLKEIMSRARLQGVTKASQQITVTAKASETRILYVQPTGSDPDVLSFEDFRTVVLKHDDPVSLRFATSLAEWAHTKAGEMQLPGIHLVDKTDKFRNLVLRPDAILDDSDDLGI